MNVFPTALTFSVVKNFSLVIKQLRKIALVISGVLLFVNLSGSMASFDKVYSMGFAGSLTLPTLALTECLINERHSLKHCSVLGIALVCNLFSLLVYGSRGAFIAIALFLVFYWRNKFK